MQNEHHSIPAELQYIKLLFLQKKHRQCIQFCEALLAKSTNAADVAYLTYVHFYLGMAHDDLARQMYNLSKLKNNRFALAEQHYEEALRLIAELQREHTTIRLDVSPRARRSPNSSPRLPREASSISLLSIGSSQWSSSSYTLPGLAYRLTEHAHALREQVIAHLNLIQQAKMRAQAAHMKRAAVVPRRQMDSSPTPAPKTLQSTKSYWSFTPEEFKADEKESRKEEGRARGWKRERFNPAKYRLLAERALEEL